MFHIIIIQYYDKPSLLKLGDGYGVVLLFKTLTQIKLIKMIIFTHLIISRSIRNKRLVHTKKHQFFIGLRVNKGIINY